MDSYTSMVKKLTDTKLYSVRTGGRTYAELKAFAAGLDLHMAEIAVVIGLGLPGALHRIGKGGGAKQGQRGGKHKGKDFFHSVVSS